MNRRCVQMLRLCRRLLVPAVCWERRYLVSGRLTGCPSTVCFAVLVPTLASAQSTTSSGIGDFAVRQLVTTVSLIARPGSLVASPSFCRTMMLLGVRWAVNVKRTGEKIRVRLQCLMPSGPR